MALERRDLVCRGVEELRTGFADLPEGSRWRQRAVELAVELGLPALEADALLELATSDPSDHHALDRAAWWIDRIGTRTARRRLAQVRGTPLHLGW